MRLLVLINLAGAMKEQSCFDSAAAQNLTVGANSTGTKQTDYPQGSKKARLVQDIWQCHESRVKRELQQERDRHNNQQMIKSIAN